MKTQNSIFSEKRLCANKTVKWWQRISPTMHVLIATAKCIDFVPNAYHEGQQYANSTTKWDWTKLPQERFNDAKEMVQNADAFGLVKLNNEYLISGYHICCDSDTVHEQFVNALKLGLIW